MNSNTFESPKLAIIRLLRSQGCCPCLQEKSNNSVQLDRLLAKRQQTLSDVTFERNRLKQIPCVITLAAQIEQLIQVVRGLGRQNRGRMHYLNKLQQASNQTVSWQDSNEQDRRQHQILQRQYSNLMRTLQAVNQTNRNLVDRLARG